MTDFKHKLRSRLINGVWSIQGTAPLVGRIRKQFPDKASADFASQKLITQVENHLAQGTMRETCLTEAQEKDAELALQILHSSSKFQGKFTLVDAVKFAHERIISYLDNITLKLAGDKFLADLKARGRSVDYLTQNEQKMNKLCKLFGDDFLVTDFTKDMVRAYIRGEGDDLSPFTNKPNTSKTTRTNELIFLRVFFNFCQGMDWISQTPTENVKGYGKNKKEIKVLSLYETRLFINIARHFSDEALAYFALSLFAGLRPEELRPKSDKVRLDWSDFIWRTGESKSTLAVTYNVGKVSSRRVIELPDNLVKILEPIKKESGPIIESSYATWRGIHDYIRAKAGYKVPGKTFRHIDEKLSKVSQDEGRPEYVRDVLRHSAITYRLEIRQNKDEVANWAGNSPRIIDEHYRAVVKGTSELDPKQYAKEYFTII